MRFTPVMNVQIDYLVNHQTHIPTLASWFRDEHPDFFAGQTLSQVAREHFESRLRTDALPISFIALKHNLPVGTIALLVESVTTHTHLTPWLGGLHVRPDQRHKGIGMSLVAHGLQVARELGFDSLYAGINSGEESYLYEGWHVAERVMYCGKPLSIMIHESPRVREKRLL
jgi:GNAT superfamily N-acetyltransferase